MTEPLNNEGAGEPAPGGKVLLADDDELFREGLSKLLRRLGYEVLAAEDATATVHLLRDHEVDALISDIHMPGNVDLELIRETPQIRRGLPVILLTGRPAFETAAQSLRLSVSAYLVKPPNIEELRSILDENIARYRSLRAVMASRDRLEKWVGELRVLEESLRGSARDKRAGSEYLRVTLQNMAIQLGELARSTAVSAQAEGGQEIEKIELISALQQTITVLEHTRKNFKSKELGELRKRLLTLVAASGDAPN